MIQDNSIVLGLLCGALVAGSAFMGVLVGTIQDLRLLRDLRKGQRTRKPNP